MFKKMLAAAMAGIIVSTSWSGLSSAASKTEEKQWIKFGGIEVFYNYTEYLRYEETTQFPFVLNGVTYLPVRKVAEALNKNVRYESSTSTIIIEGRYNGKKPEDQYSYAYETTSQVKLKSVKVNLNVDGKLVAKSIDAYSINNTTFLPVRQVAEYTDTDIEWDPSTKSIYLEKKFEYPNAKRSLVEATAQEVESNIDMGTQFLESYDNVAPSVVTRVGADGHIYVAAAEKADNGKLTIAKYDSSMKLVGTQSIPKEYPYFGGLALDEQGRYYVLWGRSLEESQGSSASVKITKYSAQGEKLGEVSYTGSEQSFMGTKVPFDHANATIKVHNGFVVAFFGRTMFKSSDGLNHQSSTALYVTSETMSKVELPIPYASHSFDQHLALDGSDILFVDRGDVYQRGLMLQKINAENQSKSLLVPFSFKMGKAIYQLTFAELGGLAVTDQGYVLLGAAERSMTPESASSRHNESRNLFLQLIAKDFENTAAPILSQGETAEFHVDVYGRSYDAKNEGVVWLTNYTDIKKNNAAHPKIAALDQNRVLVMWENMKYNSDDTLVYDTTYYIIVTPEGKVLKGPESIEGARLNIGDELVYADGYVYFSSNYRDKMHLYQLDVRQ
ncbi:stalk domain-containing protein [Paenibacillus sp. NPDC057967]|uniref:stalk domain-containing protein n=1 Tax=Paenibacillus sp. NPDC057967 TaxID=3346293 RepID=UPI0036DA221F